MTEVTRCGDDPTGIGFGRIVLNRPNGRYVFPVCTCNADQSGHDEDRIASLVAQFEYWEPS